MPRRVNERTTTSATSGSQPGRIFGSASSRVTCDAEVGHHRRELAADRAAADDRDRLRQSRRVEHLVGGEHERPSGSKPGMVRGTEPDGEDDVRRQSGVDGSRRRGHLDDRVGEQPADAGDDRHLALLIRPARPSVELVDDSALRSRLTANSTRRLAGLDAELLGAGDACGRRDAVSRNSLAGMQPRCRQVPPTLSFSTMAIDSPAAAP